MKYVLMQGPKKEGEFTGEILIVDNSRRTGKEKVERLLMDGYSCVGHIESELKKHELKSGLEKYVQGRLDKAMGLLSKIWWLASERGMV